MLSVNSHLTCAGPGGAGLSAAAMTAVSSGSALVSHGGGGAVGGGGGRPHGRPREPAVGGAQQSARRTRPTAG